MLVDQLMVENATKQRLEAMGMIHNTPIEILKNKNGLVIFKVRGTRLALGKRISEKILVKMQVE